MRPAILALALGLPALTAALAVAGAALRAEHAAEAVEEAVAPPQTAAQKSLPVIEDRSTRFVAVGGIAPPDLGDAPIERVEPRAPLGELGLAAPPRPKEEGPLLFRPVAVESAVVEAGERRVAIAGTVSVPPDRVCGAGEASWPCG
ncbi:MAG: thermonuclease family protein, partial [Rhizobiaceae bacterium]